LETFTLAVVLGVIVLVIVLARLRVSIGLALLVGSLLLTLILAPQGIPQVIISTITYDKTWFLITVSFSIALLTELYQATRLIDEMGKALTRIIREPRLALILVPGIIGLLPVAGGALMSAPIVDIIARGLGLPEVIGVYVNVWFRHIIFISYPLGQGIIVTSTLTNIPVEQLVLRNLPITLFMAIIGYVIALKGRVKGVEVVSVDNRLSTKPLIPFILSLVLALILRYIIGDYGMPIGVMIGVTTLIAIAKPTSKILYKVLTKGKLLEITLAAFSIIFFQRSLTVTGASDTIAEVLNGATIPLIIVEVIVPYIIAYSLGSIIMAVTLTIPLIQSLTTITLAHASMVYVSAFLGHLAAPTHLCLIYTTEYFKKTLADAYKYIMPSILLALLFTILYNMLIP